MAAKILVITDVRMPDLSGLELARRIHTMAPRLPIIVITAFGGMETAVKAMRGEPATSSRSLSIGPISVPEAVP